MKKLLIYGAVVLLIFVSLAVVTNVQQTKKAEGNPFGKEKLHAATTDLLDDPNYQNVILPDELADRLSQGEELTVYFYSPTCAYCKETTPRLAPLAEDLGIDLVQYNLLEFEEGWTDYRIDSTPTLIHFENGEEKDRVVGAATNEEFTAFFNQHVID